MGEGGELEFGPDSVARWVRFFPTQMTRAELEGMLGDTAVSETRNADFKLRVTYSDTVVATYGRSGTSVVFIEYGMMAANRLASLSSPTATPSSRDEAHSRS